MTGGKDGGRVMLGDIIWADPVLVSWHSLPTHSPATASNPQVPILQSIANCCADQWQWGGRVGKRGGGGESVCFWLAIEAGIEADEEGGGGGCRHVSPASCSLAVSWLLAFHAQERARLYWRPGTVHTTLRTITSIQAGSAEGLEGGGLVHGHRGDRCVSIPKRSLNQENLAVSYQGQSTDLGRSRSGNWRGGWGG